MNKMILDELKGRIESRKFSEDQGIDQEMLNFNNGLETAIEIIETNRDALEAGLKGTLRFRAWVNYDNQYILIDIDGVDVIIKTSMYGLKEKFVHTRKRCEALAESLGLTAEFVEETDEQCTKERD